jgi:hypothetical protein
MPVKVAAASAPLMSMPEIAELARVKREVVTNWRRRHRDFPDPAGETATQLLFDPRQVANWLIISRKKKREEIEPELSLYTLAGLERLYPHADLVAAVTALICLRYLIDPNEALADGTDDVMNVLCERAAVVDPDDEFLLSEIRDIPEDAGWVARLVDELVESAWGCHRAFERILASRHRFRAIRLFGDAVIPELARLVAGVSGARERARRTNSLTVTDPAARAGDLLMAVTDLLGPDHEPRCVAAEADAGLARLLRRRLTVRGVHRADVDVRVSTGFPDASRNPDVLVTQVPYRPTEDLDPLGVLDFVEEAALRLTSDRFAVVLGPASILVGDLPTGPAGRRADLLKADMVEAVLRLPGGCLPYRPAYETALWVLTQARGSRWSGRVLLADVSDRELTADVVRDLAEDVVTWRRDGYVPSAHNRLYGVQAEVGSLVGSLGPLLTARRPTSPRERKIDADTRIMLVTQYGADLDRIGATAVADRAHVRTEVLAAADRHPAAESVGALVHQHRLIMRKGTRIKPGDADPSGHHVVLGPDEVLGVRQPGERRADREMFASRYPNAQLTQPGDVLVTMTPRPGAIIDWDGYAIAEYPVRILRIAPAKPAKPAKADQPAIPAEAVQFTSRVLCALLFGDGSGTRPAGAVRAAGNVEEQRLLLLPPGQLMAYDGLLASIDARRTLAQQEIDMLDELRQVATSGLIDGTLTLVSDDA